MVPGGVLGPCVVGAAGDDVPGLGLAGAVGLTDPLGAGDEEPGGDDDGVVLGAVVVGPGEPVGDGLRPGAGRWR